MTWTRKPARSRRADRLWPSRERIQHLAGSKLLYAFAAALVAGSFGLSQPKADERLLFRTGFEDPAALQEPLACWDTGCWQEVDWERDAAIRTSAGIDTGAPPFLPKFLLLTEPVDITAGTIGEFMHNRIEPVAGPDGETTYALYQEISRNSRGREPMALDSAQNELKFMPADGARQRYIRYWLRFQPDLPEKMSGLPDVPGVIGGGTWRAFFGFKTGGRTAANVPADDGDYRVEAYVMTLGGRQPYWLVMADNNAGGAAPQKNDWTIENRSVPVPVGEWFRFDVYWRRSTGDDGFIWMAVNCDTIAERAGPNFGADRLPVNRIMAPMLYAGSAMPVYQWVDRLEVWSEPPPDRCPSLRAH
jgi:hypothetical protein